MRLKKTKALLISITVIMIFCSCNLQPNPIYQLPSELVGKLEPWEGDIYFLEYELPQLHKNVYHTISKEEYKQNIQTLKQECATLESEKQWVKIRTFVASINDAHTAYSSKMDYAYPLNIVVLEDGVFVTAALEDNKDLLRTSSNEASRVELIAINGIPIYSNNGEESVYSIIRNILSHENDSYLKSLMTACLLDPIFLYGAGITTSKTSCDMTFLFPDSSEETITFNSEALSNFKNLNWKVYYSDTYPADRSLLPPYIQFNKETYYGKYYPTNNTLYILYNSCRNDENQSFSDFIKQQYLNCNGNPVDKIVIDLRNNGGGDSRIIKPLYNLLKNELSNSTLYVITGENTFSSALMNAIELSKNYDGILVGSPTGGKPNHYGEVKSTQLPTGNRISWSTNYFTMIPGDNNDSLYPQIPIEIPSTDFFSLKDTILDSILQMD